MKNRLCKEANFRKQKDMASTALKGHTGKRNYVRMITAQNWTSKLHQNQISLRFHHKKNPRIVTAHGKPKDLPFYLIPGMISLCKRVPT